MALSNDLTPKDQTTSALRSLHQWVSLEAEQRDDILADTYTEGYRDALGAVLSRIEVAMEEEDSDTLEDGTVVTYHGSLTPFHGKQYRVYVQETYEGETRYLLRALDPGGKTLYGARRASLVVDDV